ncbi:MAG: response regulator [Deltaproteobacteria bacterium]|nr:response regulator [Deltaproteobacteria bacterium]
MLIIEDSRSAQQQVAHHFEKLGFVVVARETGEEALDWLRGEETVALVICDLGLPGIGGSRVIEALRLEDATAKVPIIVCSGRVSLEDRARALEAGADVFVEKPFSMRTLEAEVRRCLPDWRPT